MKKGNRSKFEKFLNNLYGQNTGSNMRKNDPIQFGVLFNEWQREMRGIM